MDITEVDNMKKNISDAINTLFVNFNNTDSTNLVWIGLSSH